MPKAVSPQKVKKARKAENVASAVKAVAATVAAVVTVNAVKKASTSRPIRVPPPTRWPSPPMPVWTTWQQPNPKRLVQRLLVRKRLAVLKRSQHLCKHLPPWLQCLHRRRPQRLWWPLPLWWPQRPSLHRPPHQRRPMPSSNCQPLS